MIVNVKKGNRIINSIEITENNEVRNRRYNEPACEVVAEVIKGGRSVNNIVHVADEVQIKDDVKMDSHTDPNYKTDSKFMSEDPKESVLDGNRYGIVQPKVGLDKEEKIAGEKINDTAVALGITPEQLKEAMAADFKEQVIYSKDNEEKQYDELKQNEEDEYKELEQYRDYETDPREKIKKKINKLEGKM